MPCQQYPYKKCFMKTIANRLKVYLSSLISDLRVFLYLRNITDIILVAYEFIHFLRRKNKGKQGFMSIKLDISKAYDRME